MVTWKVKGLYKADAEAVYSEITALGDSFSPCSTWRAHSSVSDPEEAKDTGDFM